MGRGQAKKKSRRDERPAAAGLGGPSRLGVLFASCVIIGVTLFAYANSLNGAFVFDDQHHIEANESIRSVIPLSRHLATRRPLVSLSVAINYAIGGLDPWGYHAFNLLVHVLAALTLFGVVRRTLILPRLAASFQNHATILALAVAALWAAHPLTTQSVTYVIQRGESMMGLCYLVTLYCVIRGADSKRSARWFGAAVAACFCGMAAKAVMITAPLIVLIYDRIFLAEGFASALRRRWTLYAGLCASCLVPVATGVWGGVFTTASVNATMGFGYKGATPLQYLCSQPGVILHYLSLALWPAGLCLDYAWPVAHGAARILLPGVVIVVLLVLTIWALRVRPALGFVGVWFFLILAPTSSIVPIRDLAFEHRMYLPLAAVVCLLVLGLNHVITAVARRGSLSQASGGGLFIIVVSAFVIALAVRTRARNEDYRSELAIWSDTAAKRPTNARAFRGVGDAYFEARQYADSITQYEEALRLNPGESGRFVYERLGTAYQMLAQNEKAESLFRRMLEIAPDSAEANFNLGNCLSQKKAHAEAIPFYRRAVELDSTNAEAYINLGLAIAATAEGNPARGDAALAAYQTALDLAEKQGRSAVCVRAHYNSGLVLIWQGKAKEAIEAYERALRINPKHAASQRKLEEARQRLTPGIEGP